jgi:hypothetical protein
MKAFSSRRSAFSVCLITVLILAPSWVAAWQSRPSPIIKPMPSPNAPKNENAPEGLEGKPTSKNNSKPPVDQQNQQEIRLDVQRLYAMATELKDDVDNTDSNAVFNVSVLKRAQEIEKLAKQIRDRAKR